MSLQPPVPFFSSCLSFCSGKKTGGLSEQQIAILAKVAVNGREIRRRKGSKSGKDVSIIEEREREKEGKESEKMYAAA